MLFFFKVVERVNKSSVQVTNGHREDKDKYKKGSTGCKSLVRKPFSEEWGQSMLAVDQERVETHVWTTHSRCWLWGKMRVE